MSCFPWYRAVGVIGRLGGQVRYCSALPYLITLCPLGGQPQTSLVFSRGLAAHSEFYLLITKTSNLQCWWITLGRPWGWLGVNCPQGVAMNIAGLKCIHEPPDPPSSYAPALIHWIFLSHWWYGIWNFRIRKVWTQNDEFVIGTFFSVRR